MINPYKLIHTYACDATGKRDKYNIKEMEEERADCKFHVGLALISSLQPLPKVLIEALTASYDISFSLISKKSQKMVWRVQNKQNKHISKATEGINL